MEDKIEKKLMKQHIYQTIQSCIPKEQNGIKWMLHNCKLSKRGKYTFKMNLDQTLNQPKEIQ